MAPGTTLTALSVFSARRSKFWLVMYSKACQRVHRLTRLPTLALPAMAATRGLLKCGTSFEIASGAIECVCVDAHKQFFRNLLESEVEGVGFA